MSYRSSKQIQAKKRHVIIFVFFIYPDDIISVPVEIGFLFDNSGQISRSDFVEQIDIAKQIVDTFNISGNLARVGAAVYSDNPRVLFNFSDPLYHSNNITQAVKDLLDKTPHDQGAAKLGDGLQTVASDLFFPMQGSESDITPQVCLSYQKCTPWHVLVKRIAQPGNSATQLSFTQSPSACLASFIPATMKNHHLESYS